MNRARKGWLAVLVTLLFGVLFVLLGWPPPTGGSNAAGSPKAGSTLEKSAGTPSAEVEAAMDGDGPGTSGAPERTDLRTALPTGTLAGIVVADPVGKPISAARLVRIGTEDILTCDRSGLLRIGRTEPKEGWLAWASGYRPKLFLRKADRCEVLLQPDPGILLTVWGRESQSPIEGAAVSLSFPVNPGLELTQHDAFRWLNQIVAELLGPWPKTDASGHIVVHGAWVDSSTGLHADLLVSAPGGLGALADSRQARQAEGDDQYRYLQVDLLDGPWPFLRVEDTHGRPIQDTPVTVWSNLLPFDGVTDQLGVVRELPGWIAADATSAHVLLADDRKWEEKIDAPGADPVVIRVDYREITGEVEGGHAGAFEVASARANAEIDQASLFDPRPLPFSRLLWVPVRQNGTFVLASGWQGPSTVVLLRHSASGAIVDAALATPGARVSLTSEPSCRVDLSVEPSSGPPQSGWRVVFDRVDPRLRPIRGGLSSAADVTVPASPPPGFVELPRGLYRATLETEWGSIQLGQLDAREDAATFLIRYPEVRELGGMVRGVLSGPLVGASVVFRRPGSMLAIAQVLSGSDGRFLATVPKEELEAVVRYRPNVDSQPAMGSGVFLVPPQSLVEDFLVEESKLVLLANDLETLARVGGLAVYRVAADGRAMVGFLGRSPEQLDLLLQPGDYVVQSGFHGTGALAQDIHLASGEVRTFTLPRIEATLLRVTIFAGSVGIGHALISGWERPSGAVAFLDAALTLGKPSSTALLVHEGDFKVTITADYYLADGTHASLAETFDVSCEKGATTEVEVHLASQGGATISVHAPDAAR